MAEVRAKAATITQRNWVEIYEYHAVTENDTLIPVECPEYGVVTMEAIGNFGAGGTIDLVGAVDPVSGATMLPMNDFFSAAAVQLTADGRLTAVNNAYQVRPDISAGTGVLVDIRLLYQEPRKRGN